MKGLSMKFKCNALPFMTSFISFASAWAAPIDVGSKRELFVDKALIESLSGGATTKLQHPQAQEIVMVHDAPWEGSGCGFHTVFRDGDIYRMYYIAAQLTNESATVMNDSRQIYAAYAESRDGKNWIKPELGLFEFEGSRRNNILWVSPGLDTFTVFKDPSPNVRSGEEYKAVFVRRPGGLFALKSADGIHWSPLRSDPIITQGTFDTQNTVFWDSERNLYWAYIRDYHNGLRDIRVSTSTDFLTWTAPVLLSYGDVPEVALYTNNVIPYYRAPHLFVGFPTRYTERAVSPVLELLPDWTHRQGRMGFQQRFGTAITDSLFMSSRDGRQFQRWDEAFVRPGIERRDNWIYGDGYQNWGLVETASDRLGGPAELSIFYVEDWWKQSTRLRRHTLRVDGFVSVNANLAGGELLTKAITFTGTELSLNFSTSGAGSIRVEIQDADGRALPGFSLAESYELFGDTLDRRVLWHSGRDVSSLAGRPIRMRFVMKDADLYSWKFEY